MGFEKKPTPPSTAIRLPRWFVQMLQLILKENIFSFADHIHRRQMRGCAMGSTVRLSLAIIFMDQLERRLLDTAPDRLWPVFYVRYFYDLDARQ